MVSPKHLSPDSRRLSAIVSVTLALTLTGLCTPGLAQSCDIDGDGLCDNGDLSVLYGDIDVAAGPGPSDMNLDGMVDNRDISVWLEDAGTLNLGRSYLIGDADLSGCVDESDQIVWSSNYGAQGLPNAYWNNANFDGNEGGSFRVSGIDLLSMQQNWRVGCSIPEPRSGMLLTCGGLLVLARFRRRRAANIHSQVDFEVS